MTETLLACISILLEFTLLVRGLRVGLVRRYIYFYYAIIFQVIANVVGTVVFTQSGILSPRYASFYWPLEYGDELVLLALLSRQILGILMLDSAGVLPKLRFLQKVVWTAVGVFTILFGWAVFKASPSQNLALHRDFDLTEALVLLAIAWAILHFDVPLGRHVRGMIVGYGMMVAADLLSFAVYAYSLPFLHRFRDLPSLAGFFGELIWLAAFWNDGPHSHPQTIKQSVRSSVARGSTSLRRAAITVQSCLRVTVFRAAG
jgi:hypothetical protein